MTVQTKHYRPQKLLRPPRCFVLWASPAQEAGLSISEEPASMLENLESSGSCSLQNTRVPPNLRGTVVHKLGSKVDASPPGNDPGADARAIGRRRRSAQAARREADTYAIRRVLQDRMFGVHCS